MKHDKSYFGGLGQWISGIVVLGGIVVEICYRAAAGIVCITIGSVLFAVFTKIRYYREKKKE